MCVSLPPPSVLLLTDVAVCDQSVATSMALTTYLLLLLFVLRLPLLLLFVLRCCLSPLRMRTSSIRSQSLQRMSWTCWTWLLALQKRKELLQ